MATRQGGIVTELDWCEKLINASQSMRKKIASDIIQSIVCFRPHNNKNASDPKYWSEPTQDGLAIVEFLKEHDIVGFIPNVYYIKATGTKDELKAMYCHPFSMFTLVFAHKKWPMLTIVNPMLSFNESRVRKLEGNEALSELHNINGIMG